MCCPCSVAGLGSTGSEFLRNETAISLKHYADTSWRLKAPQGTQSRTTPAFGSAPRHDRPIMELGNARPYQIVDMKRPDGLPLFIENGEYCNIVVFHQLERLDRHHLFSKRFRTAMRGFPRDSPRFPGVVETAM